MPQMSARPLQNRPGLRMLPQHLGSSSQTLAWMAALALISSIPATCPESLSKGRMGRLGTRRLGSMRAIDRLRCPQQAMLVTTRLPLVNRGERSTCACWQGQPML